MIIKSLLPPKWSGIAIGGAVGVTLLTLLAFRALWVAYLLSFSIFFGLTPLTTFFILLAIAFFVGGAMGARVAEFVHIRPLATFPTIVFALLIAVGPSAAGYAEVVLRGPPFPLPQSVETAHWQRYPWGDQLLQLESEEPTPVLHDQLVEAAMQVGWICEYCQYQASTKTAHAKLTRSSKRLGGSEAQLTFEIWPGEMAFYEIPSSSMTQVRMGHQRRARSVEWTSLVLVTAAMAATVMVAVGGTRK